MRQADLTFAFYGIRPGQVWSTPRVEGHPSYSRRIVEIVGDLAENQRVVVEYVTYKDYLDDILTNRTQLNVAKFCEFYPVRVS